MKLHEVLERLQMIYSGWGDIDVFLEVPDNSPENNQGLVRYGIYDIRGFGPIFINGKCVHDEKIVALMGEEWKR